MDDKSYWDRVAERYIAGKIANVDAYAQTLRLAAAHLTPDMTGVEIGCGSGMTARRLSPSMGRLTATDISDGMIDHARRLHAEENGPANLDYAVATLDDLKDRQVDAVLAFNVLHLLPDRDAALARIHAMLRPNGMLVSKTPCVGGAYQAMRAAIMPMQWLGKAPETLRYFTPAQLEASVRKAGFEILGTATLPRRPPARFIAARRLG